MKADERELREQLRAWLAENLPPEWRRSRLDRMTPEDSIAAMKAWGRRVYDGGWSVPQWPRSAGGRELSARLMYAYLEEMARAEAPYLRNRPAISIFGQTLLTYGTEEQKERYLPAILSHDELWCQCFSEPEAGSDLASLRTRATPTEGGYVIDGQKLWTSAAQNSDKAFILVRTSSDGPKHRGITFGVVDMHQPGVTVRPLRDITDGHEFNEIFFEGAFMRAEDVVGEVGQGWQSVNFALSHERGTSLAPRVMELEHQFGSILGEYRQQRGGDAVDMAAFAPRLVDAFISTRVTQSLIRRNITMVEDETDLGSYPAMTKLTWSLAYQELGRLGHDLQAEAGAAATESAAEWTKALLMSRPATVYAGASEIQRNLIARSLGLPSSRTSA